MYTNSQTSDLYNDLYNKITSEQPLNQNDLRNIQLLKERYNKLSNNIHEYNGTNVVADAVKMFNKVSEAGFECYITTEAGEDISVDSLRQHIS